MNNRTLLNLTAIVSVSLLAAHSASAQCRNGQCSRMGGNTGPTVTYMKGKTIKANAQPAIASVSGNSITLDSKTYRTDANTKVYINGNAASLERLQQGMRAKVDASLLQPSVARTISASTSS